MLNCQAVEQHFASDFIINRHLLKHGTNSTKEVTLELALMICPVHFLYSLSPGTQLRTALVGLNQNILIQQPMSFHLMVSME